jgi:hypothetical protein
MRGLLLEKFLLMRTPQVDFSKVNAALHQMGNANLQAGMVQDNTGLLRREWANMWE